MIMMTSPLCHSQNWNRAEQLIKETDDLTEQMSKLEVETSNFIKWLLKTEKRREYDNTISRCERSRHLINESCKIWIRDYKTGAESCQRSKAKIEDKCRRNIEKALFEAQEEAKQYVN